MAASRHVSAAALLLAGSSTVVGCTNLGTAVGTMPRSEAPLPSLALPPLPVQPAPPRISEGTYRVPASLDATGASDVAPALQRFVDGVPDGAVIEFPTGATYRLEDGLQLWRRKDLVFDGNGATLLARGKPDDPGDSAFALMVGDERIVIRNFAIEGDNPDAGTKDAFHGRDEHLAAFYIGGATDILIEDVMIRDLWGDCAHIGSNTTDAWSSRVAFQDSTCVRTGRHGVSVIAAEDVSIQRSRFDDIGFMIVDIEPDGASQGATSVTLRDSSIGRYGLTDQFVSWVLAAYGGVEGSTVDDVSVIGNVIEGNPHSGIDNVALGLNVVADGDVGPRSNFTIRDNTSSMVLDSPPNDAPIYFDKTDGVVVIGNVQPMAAGELAVFRDSTGVVFHGNDADP